jgi:hypothetical protein
MLLGLFAVGANPTLCSNAVKGRFSWLGIPFVQSPMVVDFLAVEAGTDAGQPLPRVRLNFWPCQELLWPRLTPAMDAFFTSLAFAFMCTEFRRDMIVTAFNEYDSANK